MFPTVDYLGTPTDIYALCALLSFLVLLISVMALKPKELSPKHVFWAVIIVMFFAYTGAKLLNVALNFPEHSGKTLLKIFRTSGVAYLGAPVFGLLAFWVYCRIIKIPFVVFGDYIAPFFMLDRMIGRLGCLGYGCCYGVPSDLPWAYAFKGWGVPHVVLRHPTQAYMIMYAFAIFVSSRYLYKKIKELPGSFALTYKDAPLSGITLFYVFFCYGILRFMNEFLRAEGPFMYGMIKFSHIALFVIAIVSAFVLFSITKKSGAGSDIINALKGSFLRLVVCFVASGIVILSMISLR